MNTNSSFGVWLKQRRKALDLTQRELADQVGCALATIHKLEADKRRPSKQIVERLADVLAIMPDERTTFMSFARRVVEQPVSSPIDLVTAPPPRNLPAHSTPFFGRETELAQITDRLADPSCRLLTLIGVGGIGKTRLATQAAENRIDDFADGVYFVSLTPVGSPSLIANTIANVLQLSFYGQQDPNTQLVNALRAKHMLLIMDNYEHLLPEITLLNDLLANVPGLKILVTSRERLNMHEEWVLPVEGLLYPGSQTNEKITSFSSVQLFIQIARRLEPNFSLESNQADVIEICKLVEGMPLAIELAASWLRAIHCNEIPDQIRQDIDFLTTPLRDVSERHRSLRAVFEHSWELLSQHERDVLMKLAVFRGGFDHEAAKAVAGASRLLLLVLVDKSLVRLTTSGRFELHELLRQFVAEKLQEVNCTAETQDNHLSYFVRLAEQIEPLLFGPQYIPLLNRLDVELNNFRAALEWAWATEQYEIGLRLAGALGWFWNRRTYWTEGLGWLERFYSSGGELSPPTKAKAVHHLLELYNEMGDLMRVIPLVQEAKKLLDALEDTRVKAWLLTTVGFSNLPYDDRHLTYLEQALALFTALEDQWGICETLIRMSGTARNMEGDFEQAQKWAEQGIRLAHQANDKSVRCWTLLGLACTRWVRGQMDAYTERLNLEALELFQELGYKNGIHQAYCQLGQIAHFCGEYDKAIAYIEESLRIIQYTGIGSFRHFALLELAEIYSNLDEPERGAFFLGAIEESMRIQLLPSSVYLEKLRMVYSRILAVARGQLDDQVFSTAYAKGQRLTLDEAVNLALTGKNESIE